MNRKANSAYALEQWKQLEDSLFGDLEINGTTYPAGESLTRLKDYARSQTLAPVATLSLAILNVCASVPPGTTFNAGVGRGSLNQMLALVGPPGSHKDRHVAKVPADLQVFHRERLVEVRRLAPGSGEGIVSALAPNDDGTSHPTVFGVSEIGNLAALMGRTGSTLRPSCLSIYSGNALGYTNKTEQAYVPANSYVACMWVGMQPDRADDLFEGKDDGLAHRFVTVEMLDPLLGEMLQDPTWRKPAPVELAPVFLPDDVQTTGITFDKAIVAATIRAGQEAIAYGPERNNSGHRHQTRLKVAAGIALLGSRNHVDLGDWHRAGALMNYSDAVQARCLTHLENQRVNAEVKRAVERERIEDKVERDRYERAERLIREALTENYAVERSELRDKARRYRPQFDEIVKALVEGNYIELRDGDRFLCRGQNFEPVGVS